MTKTYILALALLFTTPALTVAQRENEKEKHSPTTSQIHVSKKLEREITKMESQLERAIAKRDAVSLERILADYYADSYEGSETAVGKKLTLSRCKEGRLPYYPISEDKQLDQRVDIVFLEGISKPKPIANFNDDTNDKREQEIRVKRLWTKKGNRWQLIAQTIKRVEDDR